ncbi:MAG TPA: DUF5979 domain-containing protein, partial [Dokdonella sp.]
AVTLFACTDASGAYRFAAGASVFAAQPADCANPGTPIAGFAGLVPGTYAVAQMTIPPGYAAETTNLGSGATGNAGVQGISSITGIGLQSNNAAISYDIADVAALVAIAKSAPATVLAGGALDYTLTLTNSGLAATAATLIVVDALPPGVAYVGATPGTGVTAVSCAGTTVLTCTLTLPAGLAPLTGTAQFSIQTTAPAQAGSFVNYAATNPHGDGTPPGNPPTNAGCTVSATTACANAPTDVPAGRLLVTKTVSGSPAGYSGSFSIQATCLSAGTDVSAGIVPASVQSVTAGTGADGQLTFDNIPQGATCTVSEGTLPATLPASYAWLAGTPTITQPAGAISATPVSAIVVNTMVQQIAGLTVVKTVSGGPATYSGSFPIGVACTLNGTPVTGITPGAMQSVGAGSAASGAVNFGNIPQGAACLVSEGSLPTAPAGYVWGTPTITQPALIAASGTTATVANTLAQQLGTLTVTKSVSGGPAGYGGSFPITATCTSNGAPVTGITPGATQTAFAGTAGSGSVAFGNIPQGAVCSVSEGALPTAPAGYTWGTPVITQPGAIGAAPGTATIVNSLGTLASSFRLIKTVNGGPGALSGTFAFAIDCGAAGTFAQAVTLSQAASGSVTISNIPSGSVCVFSEGSNLPAAPGGFAWGALPAAQTRTIDGSDVSFVNTLTSDVTPPNSAAAVPALRDAMLALLALLMIGTGVRAARSRQHDRGSD